MPPLLKWVGAKTQLLAQIAPQLPPNFTGYCEPFAGGAALFWYLLERGLLEGKPVILGDANASLIELYREVRDDPEYLIDYCDRMRRLYAADPEGLYYRVRDAWNAGTQTPGMFLFLKQTSFNGLLRYNKRGALNMAWGKYPVPRFPDGDTLRAASAAFQSVELLDGSVFRTLERVPPGWLVYLDPPYAGTFNKYDADGFDGVAHRSLIARARHLAASGVSVLYSNSDSPEVLRGLVELWPSAQVMQVFARDKINCDGGGRKLRPELLAFEHADIP